MSHARGAARQQIDWPKRGEASGRRGGGELRLQRFDAV